MTSVELGRYLVAYERNAALAVLAEKTFAREKSLKEQKVGSEQDMINAQMAHEQHRTELKASEQTLHVLGLTEADLSGMKESLHGADAGKLPVRAPIAGTIIEKHAVAGEMAEPGKDVMLLADLSTVWIWVDLHAQDLPQLLEAEKLGKVPVDIAVSAFPGKKFSGMITYVGATMNEKTRTVKVRATVGNPDLVLRPGMFCEATIALGSKKAEEVLAVPRDAVFVDEGKSFIFKHWKDDLFVRQDVLKGREFSGVVEICEGLQAGEMIVTDGAFLLKSDILRKKMGAGCAD
jgi:cobalt-zinc-cadmium efflux system membrane fusion protein